jgi:hypothetical protein
MNDWQQDLFKALEDFADDVEQFVTDIAKEVAEATESWIQASEEIAEQFQTVFIFEVDRYINEWVDPIVDAYFGFENAVGEAAQPMLHTVEPIINDHPACVGCRHYHGQSYGGHMLVCGMHPYGWEEEKCPDWQATWENKS